MTRLTPADHDRIHRLALARAAQLRGEAFDRLWSILVRRIAGLSRGHAPMRGRTNVRVG